MAGSFSRIDSVADLAATEVKALTERGSLGAHGSANYFIDVASITGTWDFAVRWKAPSGATINIVVLNGVTTTGVKRLALTSDFIAAKSAIFPHSERIWTLSAGPGVLSVALFLAFGD